MEAVITTSRIVDADQLIPGSTGVCEQVNVTPWVFEHAEFAFADLYCVEVWPRENTAFKYLFDYLRTYLYETDLRHASEATKLENAMKEVETVTLPRKSWAYPAREDFHPFVLLQGFMMRTLLETIYLELGMDEFTPQIHFPASRFRVSYFIGGQKYTAKPEGAVMVGPTPNDERLPILSFSTWYKGQTWGDFLGETLSIMFAQLSQNIRLNTGLRDQEVFVTGFFGRQMFVVRGYFTAAQISRVHAHGFSVNEGVELQFSRGYDLTRKEEWVEGTQLLIRLLRYFISGGANVGALQQCFH